MNNLTTDSVNDYDRNKSNFIQSNKYKFFIYNIVIWEKKSEIEAEIVLNYYIEYESI